MRRSGPSTLLALVTSLAACGDDLTAGAPDAAPAGDAALDAPPLPGGCAFTELRDLTNDDIIGAGTPEVTSTTLATTLTLCGAINADHFNTAEAVVDADGYLFTVATESDILVTVSGAGIEALPLVQLQLYGGSGLNMLAANTVWVGDHAVFSLHVLPGTYEVAVIASADAAIASPIAYEIAIGVDAIAARCPAATTTAYTEAQDGAASDGNDVVRIDRSASPTSQLTAATTDAPEPTGVTLAATGSARLDGTSASVPRAGSYFDKDTYAFTTGPTTNQLTLRLGWPGSTVDLDLHLFEAGQLPYLHRSITTATMAEELVTVAVKPGTTYWLWIGADYVLTTGLPVTYAATLCGATFSP